MSATRNDSNEYEIDPAELFRVFKKKTDALPSSEKKKVSHELLHKLEMLQAAMAHKEELLDSERASMRREREQFEAQIEDLRNTVETLSNQNGATLKLIADEIQKPQKHKAFFDRWIKPSSQ
ncbi:MAG: hypothetical protein ABJH52_17170 [Henriciella sp.]